MRLFLGEEAKINGRWIITNDHGLKGLTTAFSIMKFAEAPYYNKAHEADCEEANVYEKKTSKSSASDRRPKTERICVKIINDGFVPKTPNSRDCFDFVRASSQMILDEGETLENLPPDIIMQYKCPYNEDGARRCLMGPKNGSWTVHTTEPVKNCVAPLPSYHGHFGIKCSHSTGLTYEIISALCPFILASNCSMRLFLGEVARIKDGLSSHFIISNDHGLKGLSKEISTMEFAEAPYFNHSLDAICKEEYNLDVIPSTSGASDRRPRTEMILIFCGVAMASAVLSF